MKPLHIAILVAAGALVGAVVTNVWQRSAAVPQPAAVRQATAPISAPAPPVVASEPAPVAQSPAPVPTTPVVEPAPVKEPVTTRSARQNRPATVRRSQPPVRTRPAPVTIAKSQPAAVAPPAVSEPPKQPVAPTVSAPPARTEPEHTTPAPPPPPPPPPPEPHKVTLNAGLLLPVRLVDGLSSERNVAGDTFTGTLDRELVVDGFVIAERGARVEGRVVEADRAGKVRGVAALAVELTALHTSDGQRIALRTDSFERRSEATHRQDAEKIGAGAAVGAIIGAIAGGGKGAAIGAGVGGGAGAGDVLLTRGKPATLPSETRISFRLNSSVTVTERL